MRPLTDITLRAAHALRTHPSLRLLLGAALVLAGVLSLLVGVGHGGLIAGGSIVLAGAVAAMRGEAIEEAGSPLPREPLADAEEPRP